MRTISESAIDLRWSRPKLLRSEYELLSKGELVGRLALHGFCNVAATAESGEGRWKFQREGILGTRATIVSAESGDTLATFRSNIWGMGGELRFISGHRSRAAMNFWGTQLRLESAPYGPLVTLRSGGLSHRSAEVDIANAARDLPELPLLVLFGWYLFIMIHRDTSAVVVTG